MNRFDELAWIRFLKMFEGVGDVTAGKVVNELFTNDPCIPVTTLINRILPGRDDIQESYESVLSFKDKPSEAIELATKHLKVLMASKYDRFENREQDLVLLSQMAQRFKSLESFIETYTLNPISKKEAEDTTNSDKVRIITVHSSKGLEANICYCIGVQPGLYPHTRSVNCDEKREEERRVLYVALTRAKNELIITRSNEQQNYFGLPSNEGNEHYFLNDLPEDLVNRDYKGHNLPQEDEWLSKLDFL